MIAGVRSKMMIIQNLFRPTCEKALYLEAIEEERGN